jgi:hypothetical protein
MESIGMPYLRKCSKKREQKILKREDAIKNFIETRQNVTDAKTNLMQCGGAVIANYFGQL